MLAAALPVLGFIRRNWSLLLLAGVAAWGAWQYLGRTEAEAELANQKLQIATDANATWLELEDKRRAFEASVLAGLDRLIADVAAIHASNQQFRARVNANAHSNRPLDPAELDALGLLARFNSDPAGGRPVRPAVAPPRVR